MVSCLKNDVFAFCGSGVTSEAASSCETIPRVGLNLTTMSYVQLSTQTHLARQNKVAVQVTPKGRKGFYVLELTKDGSYNF